MPRIVSLSGINAKFQFGYNGATFNIKDDDTERSGRLRIGSGTVAWTKAGKGHKPIKKTWNQLIDFLKSE